MMKRVFIALFAIFVLSLSTVCFAGNIPDATKDFYANDFAGVLTKETISHIVEKGKELYERTGAQIVITTVDFVGDTTMDDFVTDMYNKYEIGTAGQDNGILLLMSIGDDDFNILPGYGFEKLFDMSTLIDIRDNFLLPDFDNGDYDAAARKSFDGMLNVVNGYYGNTATGSNAAAQSPSYGAANDDRPYSRDSVSSGSGIASGIGSVIGTIFSSFMFIVIIAVIIIVSIASSALRPRYRHRPRGGFFFGPFYNPHHHHHHHDHHNHHHKPPRGGGFGGFGGGGFGGGGGRSGGGGFGGGGGRSGGGGLGGGSHGGGGRSGGGGLGRK